MNFFNEINDLSICNIPFVLCIVVETEGSTPRKAGAKMAILKDGSVRGTIGGGNIEKHVTQDALEIFESGLPLKKFYNLSGDEGMHCGGKMTIYMEPVMPHEQLVIFGAGHVGRAIAQIASVAGFRVLVTDSRLGIFSSWPASVFETMTASVSEAMEKISFHKNSYIVVCTHQHTTDSEVTAMCINKPHRYLGMMGSSRKIALARKRFSEEFGMNEEQINSIDMPVGIPIKCETPADIAVSIIAKLIDIKNSQTNES